MLDTTYKVLQIAGCLDNVGAKKLVLDASTAQHVATMNLLVCQYVGSDDRVITYVSDKCFGQVYIGLARARGEYSGRCSGNPLECLANRNSRKKYKPTFSMAEDRILHS
jgi:hypothetical protein